MASAAASRREPTFNFESTAHTCRSTVLSATKSCRTIPAWRPPEAARSSTCDSRFVRPCGLKVLEATFVAHVIRPFSTHRPTEIVSAPKVYGFDTGFVAYYRGWQDLRLEDLGMLWEHFALNEIMARQQTREISYWRDKRGHEVDFVLTGRRNKPVAVECKWSASDFDATNLQAFRRQYSDGENVVLAQDVDHHFTRHYGDIVVRFENLQIFVSTLDFARL